MSARSSSIPHRATRCMTALACCWLAVAGATSAQAETTCGAASMSAELTTIEGTVEVQRGGSGPWTSVATGERLCYGDTLRTAAYSRATLTLPDYTTLRLDAHTTFGLRAPESAVGSLVELIRGVIHVISRDPRSLSFTTPYANAGLEGTEFDIRVRDAAQQTEVVVLEGRVAVTTPAGAISVGSGNVAVAARDAEPSATPVGAAIDHMRWAGHYPAVLDAPLPEPDAAPPVGNDDADFYAARAAARLATAQVDAAREDLAAAKKIAPANATALALEAVIALVHGDHASAVRFASDAKAATPARAAAFIAAAYVDARSGGFASARDNVERALALEPNNAVAATLLAELALAEGQIDASLALATRAEALAPDRAGATTVRGFAELRRLDSTAARTAFDIAAKREPADPLPHLGLALALAQQGDLVGGRRELELAVTLDPGDSLTRSYMAKIYNTEHREKLTTSQLELAQSFDRQDPTPWLYSAMHKLRTNRPIEALQDLRAAAERNGNQPVLRSRLAVDEDAATRSAGLARLHSDLGFDRMALLSAWRATTTDPRDYAGHRLLSDAYGSGVEDEIARVSESLVAQLLQPLNVTPVKPQLGQQAVFIGSRLGPSALAFSEFTAPVVGNGLRLEASAVAAGNGTVGEDVTLAGLHDELSYSVGQYRLASDGFRPNNDIDQRAASGLVQYRPSARTSLQAELRSTRTQNGDLALRFNPEHFNAAVRTDESVDTVRFGVRQDLGDRRSLLASVAAHQSDSDFSAGPIFQAGALGSAYSADLLVIQDLAAGSLEYGFRYASRDDDYRFEYSLPFVPPSTVRLDAQEWQTSAYAYAHLDVTPTLTLTFGASADRIENDAFTLDDDALNPKLGLLWQLHERTTLRLAAFSTLYTSLTTSRQTPQPRLEPFQIAGFSQGLFGSQGDRADVVGLGLDHAMGDRLHIGYEALRRDNERTYVDPYIEALSTYPLDEHTHDAYVYWTPSQRTSVAAHYEKRRYSTTPLQPYGFTHLAMERLPIEARYFSPTGFTAGVRVSHIHEKGIFEIPPPPGVQVAYAPGTDRFWVVDAFVGYRLPNRRGFVSLNADNLFDERFQFQDVDPEIVSVMPERLVSVRFTLSFD